LGNRRIAGSRRCPAGPLPHRLSGEWNRLWECHIEPDWLLIWDETEEKLTLVRTGTHADLFE
jgi:mRNA interferase YafQ